MPSAAAELLSFAVPAPEAVLLGVSVAIEVVVMLGVAVEVGVMLDVAVVEPLADDAVEPAVVGEEPSAPELVLEAVGALAVASGAMDDVGEGSAEAARRQGSATPPAAADAGTVV
jgi:hypothetical protein